MAASIIGSKLYVAGMLKSSELTGVSANTAGLRICASWRQSSVIWGSTYSMLA